MRIVHLVSGVLVLVLSGCATVSQSYFKVSVDSLASPSAQEKHTYILLPGNEGVTRDDLQFKEYAQYLVRVLDAKGFVMAQNADDADVAIILSYGIGNPQKEQYSYSLPVWGQTGVSSSTTYGNINSYGNSASYSGTTTYTPRYGVTGYSSHIGTRTTYFRYAVIAGYDFKEFKETKRQVQIWTTSITSTGTSGDLRQMFPILISASVPYLATNTGQKVQVYISENDKVVRAVKEGVVEDGPDIKGGTGK